MSTPAVAVRDLGKTYKVYSNPWERVLEAVIRRPRHRPFVALSGVSFDLPRGEGLGVIGQNGAGKSTLLKILAGIVAPSTGGVTVEGKVAAILELGSGFHPEFTGRQNIRLNAAMLGLTAQELEAKVPSIIEFSELGAFIDQPVKTYSTGMAMRLGFAIATQVEPDVLIIDEALSVGDGYFQKKCMDHLQGFLADGGTLLFCSHAMYYVSAFCQQAMWLRNGKVEALGEAREVIDEYENFLVVKSRRAAPDARPEEPHGTGKGRLVDARLSGGRERLDGQRSFEHGEPWGLDVEWVSEDEDVEFHLAVGIDRGDDVQVLSFATHRDDRKPFAGHRRYRASLRIPEQPLSKGEFTIYVFLLDERGLHIYDQMLLPRAFRIESPTFEVGLVRAPHHWEADAPSRSEELIGARSAAHGTT